MTNEWMHSIIQKIRRNARLVGRFVPICAFIVPTLILYYLYPSSFELMWKGRTFYLFFLWLVFLEIVLEWDNIPKNTPLEPRSIRTVILVVCLLLPTVYIVVANYFGLNAAILNFAKQNNVSPNVVDFVPLSTEYLVLTALFAMTIFLFYGTDGLKTHMLSALFLGAIGTIYMIDNLYPWGKFTPFQIFVPVTATLAANVLTSMGYKTNLNEIRDPNYGWLQSLRVTDPNNPLRTVKFEIAWPCAGVESLLIYTVTILLFLKNTPIPWKQRAVYFLIGAVVTFLINILRVVTIFIIGMNTGGLSAETEQFHNFYGQLYSITWIISYPLIIMGSRTLWAKINAMRQRGASTIDSFESVNGKP